jgi:multidrug efflux pump subunit AcrA (membrane-fusion protein)
MKRIRWPALVTAGLLVAGSGTAYAVTNDGSTGHYRTVRATRDDVEEVLSASGTVDAAHRADLELGADGTVAAVEVALGETVRAGQVIARLDTGDLEAAVTRARASLARALAQLESDEDAQAAAVADAASTPASTPSSPSSPSGNGDSPSSSPGTGTDPALAAALAQLEKEQAAVVDAQTAAGAAIAAAKDALAAQTQACADAYQDQPGGATDDAPDAPADEESSGSDPNDACAAALADVQTRQGAVSDAQDALADALSTLAGTLSTAVTALEASSKSPSASSTGSPSASATGTPSASGSKTPSSNGTNPTSGEVSAAQLASDQAAIEQARADLVDARLQLRQAVLRSTRSGRVVALDVKKGDAVSAGDVAAVVVGGKAVTIATTVPESKVARVAVGQRVRVSTPGESDSAEGTVTAIGLVADSSSGTASYPVTVTVEDPTIALPTGSQALLAIVVGTAKDVVTVPISAITRRGTGASVRTWDGSKLTNEAVTLGTVGARDVEVTDGLSAGDEVVLADIDQAISGASDTLNERGGFGNLPEIRFDKAGPGGGPPVTFRSGG